MASKKPKKPPMISQFSFQPGAIIANKYEICEKLGKGWEGEVYRVVELETNVERTAKFYFPHRNHRNKVAARTSHKVDSLASCRIVIRYHTQEFVSFRGHSITCVIAEYFDGAILSEFISSQQGKRIGIMQGLILLHTLVQGLETMHRLGEYHGDLHSENILIKRSGLGFELKILDLHHWGDSKKANINEDICNSIRIFYDAIGGAARYSKQPIEVKKICLGLKKGLILKKFRSAGDLKKHLETINWQSSSRV